MQDIVFFFSFFFSRKKYKNLYSHSKYVRKNVTTDILHNHSEDHLPDINISYADHLLFLQTIHNN